jgi:hypothetical protein
MRMREFGLFCARNKMIYAILAASAVALTGPMARGQISSAPPPGGDRCPEVCSEAFTRQLNDEEKKVFAQCVAQKKCAPAAQAPGDIQRQNPLMGPFQRF